MSDIREVQLQFTVDDAGEGDDLLRQFEDDVADRDLGTTSYQPAASASGRAKPGAELVGWVSVTLAVGKTVYDLLKLAGEWAERAKRPVRVRIGKDVDVELPDSTAEQREAIVQAVVARLRRK
ncbi:hypothetical protein [Actinoplanes sp. NPDC049681]|uniref:hypothetical protein n=1 Tax=Actinoplanes sp. NPDC049681 TaxID=3363905 RepID=UPI0037AE76EA